MNPGTYWRVGWLGPSAGLEILGRSVAPTVVRKPARHASSLDYTEYATLSWKQPKSNPITVLDRPWAFQEVEAPRFQGSLQMKVVDLLLREFTLHVSGVNHTHHQEYRKL